MLRTDASALGPPARVSQRVAEFAYRTWTASRYSRRSRRSRSDRPSACTRSVKRARSARRSAYGAPVLIARPRAPASARGRPPRCRRSAPLPARRSLLAERAHALAHVLGVEARLAQLDQLPRDGVVERALGGEQLADDALVAAHAE